MTNSEIIRELSRKLEMPQKETRANFKNIVNVLGKLIDEQSRLSIPGLGTFTTKIIKARKSFDPHRKVYNLLPPKRIIKFFPSSNLKDETKELRRDNE